MTKEIKHDPLPWRAYKTWIFDANENHVIGDSERLTNNKAEFIVKAVNSFESNEAEIRRLKESNEKLLETVKILGKYVNPNISDKELKKVNQAIALAKKQP